MRILHLPTATGGNSWGLSVAERKLGYDSTVLAVDRSYLAYQADKKIRISDNKIIAGLQMFKTALSVRNKYDVFHFNAGKTLMDYPQLFINYLDRDFYKNKKCLMTFNGCGARLKYQSSQLNRYGACNEAECGKEYCASQKYEENKVKRFKIIEETGMTLFSVNPDLMNFLPEKTIFIPYTISGWCDIEQQPVKDIRSNDVIRIVHAPTNRLIKGSEDIIKIVERIKEKNPGKVELQLIENMSHNDAIEAYKKADIIIDQIRIGWYGAFAVEAIKLGKPVITYINERDLKYISPQMKKDVLEAFFNANKDNLEDVLQEIVDSPDLLKSKYQLQKEYIYNYHDPIKIAKQMISYYEI